MYIFSLADNRSRSAGIQTASSQPLLERVGSRRLRKAAAKAKSPSHHLNQLAVEPRRLRSRQQALERRKLLTARTGSLYDFISPNSSSPGPSSLVSARLSQPTEKMPSSVAGTDTLQRNFAGDGGAVEREYGTAVLYELCAPTRPLQSSAFVSVSQDLFVCRQRVLAVFMVPPRPVLLRVEYYGSHPTDRSVVVSLPYFRRI